MRDRREFTLMGHEKLLAANESAQAIAARTKRMRPVLCLRAITPTMAGGDGGVAPASQRSGGAAGGRPASAPPPTGFPAQMVQAKSTKSIPKTVVKELSNFS